MALEEGFQPGLQRMVPRTSMVEEGMIVSLTSQSQRPPAKPEA
jgi:hypothetical protein